MPAATGRLQSAVLALLLCLAAGLAHAADLKQTPDQFWADAQKANRADKSPASQDKMQWWRDARFGMFIHWGPASLSSGEISWGKDFGEGKEERPNTAGGAEPQGWWPANLPKVPPEVYDNLYLSFYPAMFDADRWVAIAKDAGMRYIVVVAKHHDGFCMWHTKYTTYDMQATPFQRDIIGELARATHKAGLKFGIYYSQRDWHHPDYTTNLAKYNDYMQHQLWELLTRYGDVSVLFFDAGNYGDSWQAQKIFKMAAELQPGIIINDRCSVPGDYSTPEQAIGAFDRERDWESCMTFTGFFSWHGYHTECIPFEECLRRLVYCAGGDGNLLMNVGPLPTGQIDPREVDRLARVGEWLQHYGQTVYGTRGGPYKPGDWGACTLKDNVVYLHVFDWSKLPARLPALGKKITRASNLTGGTVEMQQTADGVSIAVPAGDRARPDTIIKLELDGLAVEIAPVAVKP